MHIKICCATAQGVRGQSPNGSIKRHEIWKEENLDLGPSKDIRFFVVHQVVKNGQNLVGSIKRHESASAIHQNTAPK